MMASGLMPETATAAVVAAAPVEKETERQGVKDGFLGMTRRMYKAGRDGQEILEANTQARIEAGYEKEKALARAKKDYGYVVWEAKATKASMPPTSLPFGLVLENLPVEEAPSNPSKHCEATLDQGPAETHSSSLPLFPSESEVKFEPEDFAEPSMHGGATLGERPASVVPVGSRGCSLVSSNYSEFVGSAKQLFGVCGDDPRKVSKSLVSEGIVRIIEVEGPVVAKRVCDIYLRGCGIRRMGRELKSIMNKALAHAIREGRIVSVDETEKGGLLFSVVRVKGSPPIRLRTRGPRTFDEIPPSELHAAARYLAQCNGLSFGSEEHMRVILDWFDLKRLTTQVNTMLRNILNRNFPYVDDFLNGIPK
jgi:hypothetical protein